jgi:hypothetical protein
MKLVKRNGCCPGNRTRNKACSRNFDVVRRTVRRVPRQSISVVVAAVPLDVRKGSAFPSASQLRIQEAMPPHGCEAQPSEEYRRDGKASLTAHQSGTAAAGGVG